MIAVLCAIALLAADPPPPSAEPVLAFADELLLHGDPERAIDEYTRYLFSCGECARAPWAEQRLAEALRRTGQPAKAAAREQEIAAKWPGTPEGHEAARAIGADWERAGDERAASDAYREYAVAHQGEADSIEQAKLAVRTALRAHDAHRVELSVPLVPDLASLPLALRNSPRPHRSRAVAGVLAAILPGSGHLYCGEWSNAFAAFSTNALFLGGAAIAANKKEWAVAGVAGAAEVFWYGGNVIGAINAADRFDVRAEDRRWRDVEKKFLPAPSLGLSFRF